MIISQNIKIVYNNIYIRLNLYNFIRYDKKSAVITMNIMAEMHILTFYDEI